MSRPRLDSIRLEYGRHSGRFELPDEDRPVVIAGRNGTGKTTLLEAFLRGLYGFSRRRPEERRRLQLREPWSGRPIEAEVCLRGADGTRYVVHRDFTTDEVVANDETTGREVFRGDGNPVGVRSESRRYQDLLREWMGFGTLEPYRGTAWIAQGELVDTKLDDELLRAAAGTHRKVEAALKELREAFETLTCEPLELGGRRKNRSRELENLREALESGVERLGAARAARERKRPLVERAAEIRREIEEVESEVRLLEAAYRPITERRSLVAERKEAETHLAAVSDSIRWLSEAEADLAQAEAEESAAEVGGRYPEDFEARLGQAQVLWERLQTLEGIEPEASGVSPVRPGKRGTRIAIVGAGLLAVGAGLSLIASAGATLAVGGALLLAVGIWLIRADGSRAAEQYRQTEDELTAIGVRLDPIATGVPGPDLTPQNEAVHRRSYRQQADARAATRRARDKSAEAAKRAHGFLRGSGPAGNPGSEKALPRLETVQEEARTALARAQLRLEEQPADPALPDGVEPTVVAVESAREDRRARRDSARERLARLDLELRDLDRTSEDVFALERELARLREEVCEAESEVAVRRFAWELVRDAYEEFRSTDQDRLLSSVNRRLGELSGGRLGPVEAVGDLATAHVGLGGRRVALDSPPLSFGEKHIALLAIRLGAADFLAGEGTHHPLLIDEPFTHLDEVRSAEVWDLLLKLAAERQVIVTTQDRLVLDHLGIQPDFDLLLPGELEEIEAPQVAAQRPPPHKADELQGEAAPDPGPSSSPVQAQLELG
jgi:DNA repair exonuclease SbcCD ATPase subunit